MMETVNEATTICGHCEGLMPDIGAEFCSDECAEKSAAFMAECRRNAKYGPPTRAGASAFSRAGFSLDAESYDLGAEGLTKREIFAAMAMQGLLASGEIRDKTAIAQNAVRMAAYLISELNQEDK
jgi:hypothetical protein